MEKKICIITGANSGIGKAAAIQIAEEGYHVVMACRNLERSQAALTEVREKSGSAAVELMQMDMSSQESIRTFASTYLEKFNRVDVLIQNAATFDITQKERKESVDGIELLWATNHLGPVLLTNLLLDALKKSEQGRVITISSKGLIAYPFLKIDLADPEFRQRKYSVQKAYYQSKLAQVMYTFGLAKDLKDTPITVNSIRVTNVKINIEERYPNLSKLQKFMYTQKSKQSISPEEMAKTYTYLATSDEVCKITGTYYDDPKHIVKASKYAYQPENISALMELTQSYLS